MKQLIEKYEKAMKNADEKMNIWENEPENEEKEKAFDLAYTNQIKVFTDLVNAIILFSDFQIDAETARAMIKTKFEDLKNLASMMN